MTSRMEEMSIGCELELSGRNVLAVQPRALSLFVVSFAMRIGRNDDWIKREKARKKKEKKKKKKRDQATSRGSRFSSLSRSLFRLSLFMHTSLHTPHTTTHSTMDELDAIEQELAEIDRKMADLQSRRSELEEYRNILLASFSDAEDGSSSRVESPPAIEKDYNRDDFAWSSTLRDLAKDHWNISQWRDKQLAVMNASLDQRDTFVLMPTGEANL